MSNKNDWDELDKWNIGRIQNEKEKSKFYYEEFNRNKKIDTFVKGLKISGSVFKIIAFIIILIVVFILATFINMHLSNLRGQVTIDVVSTIQNMYNTKVKVVSKDVNPKEDGIYRLEVKKNRDIQFNAIKEGSRLKEDFLDRNHQYYFNKWDSFNKAKFTVNQTINNEVLEYDTYIPINNYEDIEGAIDIIYEFKEFCGEDFYSLWNIYLKQENKRIYPCQNNTMIKEEAINNAKELYKQYFN